MELRDYQVREMIHPARVALRSSRSVVVTGPTGSGKTACIAYICERAVSKGMRVLVLLHKGIIQRQVMETLARFEVPRAGIMSGRPILESPVQVAMVGTLINRLDKIPTPDMIIVDECHHMVEGNQWGRVVRHYQSKKPRLLLLGFTATPQGRTDGKGLHPFFERIVQGPSLRSLTAQGWLTWPKVWNVSGGIDFKITRGEYDRAQQEEYFSRTKVVGDVIEHYRQHLDGMPTLVSCASLKHAAEMAERYESYAHSRGLSWKAVMIQGGKKHERQMLDALKGLANGSVQIVTFCDVIGEGVDVPVCMGLQMLRKTTSLVLFLQFIGRILRPVFSPGFNQYASTAEERLRDIAGGIKPYAILLDHVGNTHIHGHPMLERRWGLGDTKKGRKAAENTELVTTMCDSCLGVWPGKPKVCPDCGADLVAQALHKEGKKTPDEIAGILKEVAPEMLGKVIALQNLLPDQRRRAMMAQVFAEGPTPRTQAMAEALGYKRGFAWRVWQMRKGGR